MIIAEFSGIFARCHDQGSLGIVTGVVSARLNKKSALRLSGASSLSVPEKEPYQKKGWGVKILKEENSETGRLPAMRRDRPLAQKG